MTTTLLIVSVVCFVLAGLGVTYGKVQFQWLGAAAWIAIALIGRLP